MTTKLSTTAYQVATASGATQAGLLQLVYSHLAHDLFSAGRAVQDNDIASRCSFSNHALLLLGHLESWLNTLKEPALEESLQSFYRMLTKSIMQLQASPAASGFEQAAQLVLDTRAAWQAKEEQLYTSTRAFAPTNSEVSPQSFSFHA